MKGCVGAVFKQLFGLTGVVVLAIILLMVLSQAAYHEPVVIETNARPVAQNVDSLSPGGFGLCMAVVAGLTIIIGLAIFFDFRKEV